MSKLTEATKRCHGAVAFIELNDDSVWQVGIVPTWHLDETEIDFVKNDGMYIYAMYSNQYCGYITDMYVVPPDVMEIKGITTRFKGAIISEELLPFGKIEVLCYKHTGIEEFKEETDNVN